MTDYQAVDRMLDQQDQDHRERFGTFVPDAPPMPSIEQIEYAYVPTEQDLARWSVDREFTEHIEQAKEQGASEREMDRLYGQWIDAVRPLTPVEYR